MEYGVNIERIAKDYGAKIAEADFDSIDGICLSGDQGHLIVVDEKLHPYNRSWAIAHEIGHIKDDTVDSYFSLIGERRANENAISTLIPDEKLMKAMDDYGEGCDFLPQLFGVSLETMQKKFSKF